MWQDWTIAAVQWGFALALIPAARPQATKPPLWTSVPTAIGMYAIAFTLATLGLWWSTGSALAGAAMWTMIAFETQQWRRENRR